MRITVTVGDIAAQAAEAIVVNLFDGVKSPGGATGAVDRALDGAITALIADREITGKLNEMRLIHTLGKLPSPRVLVAGLGKAERFDTARARQVSATASRHLRTLGVRSFATILHGTGRGGVELGAAAQSLAEGAILGLYRFERRKGVRSEEEEPRREIDEIVIVEADGAKKAATEEGVRIGTVTADSACFARDLINEPANYMTPTHLADAAATMAKEVGLACRILDRPELERLGMGCFLGVAAGSQQPPKLIVLTYASPGPRAGTKPTLGLLGKGITFDSGGISIKPAAGMGNMKMDMSGAATVIGAMRAVALLRPDVNVTALAPATENLPSGSAVKPADVLVAMNGKTVEVDNTDAEGRLVLADALCYARQEGLSPLVDVATLTGAMGVALGDVRTGFFSTDYALAEALVTASERAGEKIWRMPLDDEYKEQNKSEWADVKNSGGRNAGAITAAQFLHEFAGDTPWAHLDIAGTAYTEKERGEVVKGATGRPLRTLVALVQLLAQA